MATTWISDNMIWEVRTEGQPDNGGGWLDAGGASTDYTQQDAPEWSEDADLSSDGTGVIITSVAGGFTANMVGNVLYITGGNPAFTARWVEITGFTDANTITVKGNIGLNKGTITGGNGRIGGALIEPRYVMTNATYGAVIHVKAGTYNAAAAWSMAPGQLSNYGQMLGYNASRGDSPRGNNRPLFNMGAFTFVMQNYILGKHFRLSGTPANACDIRASAILENVYIENTSALANRVALRMAASSQSRVLDCEITCPNSAGGKGVDSSYNNTFISCYVHHADVGFSLPGGNHTLLHNIIANCDVHGVYISPAASSYNINVLLNAFYNNGIDIEVINRLYSSFIWGNIFEGGADGVTWWTDLGDVVELDYNNFHGKSGNDVTNVSKGVHATADDPLFVTPGTDFRLQDASPCRDRVPSIFLAVGL